jgi:hypothetical protein
MPRRKFGAQRRKRLIIGGEPAVDNPPEMLLHFSPWRQVTDFE